jgi:hypothetical protein
VLSSGTWLVLVALHGCSSWTSTAPEDRVPVVESVSASDVAAPDTAAPQPMTAEPAPAPVPSVAVVLSKDTRAYTAVADALGDSLKRPWVRYEITDRNADAVLRNVRAGGHSAAIAIGQQALTLLGETSLPIAFCQILEPAAGAAMRRGVAPLPAYGAQLDAWRPLQPGLARIGVITGPGHDAAAAALTTAAHERALDVRHAVARSDREMLHLFQRMVPDIQGYLLYPDTRILSPGTLREMLAYANKHGVWVLTYNRPIFELGATLLVSADPQEIAEQAVAALQAPESEYLTLPLRRAVIEWREPPRATIDRRSSERPVAQAGP